MTGAWMDKQRGVKELRLTAEHGYYAEHGPYLKPYARLLLAVAALRNGNRKRVRELLGCWPHSIPKADSIGTSWRSYSDHDEFL